MENFCKVIIKQEGKDDLIIDNQEDFDKIFPKIELPMNDRGFGMCTCGCCLEKINEQGDLACYNQAYCKDGTGIIKVNKLQ